MALTRRQREILDYLAEFIRTRRYSPSLEEIATHFGLSSVATVHKHVANLEKKGFIRRAWNRSRSIDLITTELPAPTLQGLRGGLSLVASPTARVADAPISAQLPGAVEALRRGIDPDGRAAESGKSRGKTSGPYLAEPAGLEYTGQDQPGSAPPDIIHLPLLGRVAAGLPIEAVAEREAIAVPAGMVGRGRSYVLQVKGDSMIGEHIQDGDYVIVEERHEARDGEKVVALLGEGDATLKTYRRQADGTILLEPANPAFETIRVREGAFTIQGVVIGVMRKYRR